ncbi:MAG: alpha/beta fold hydrolase [Pseudomonadota bacterium]
MLRLLILFLAFFLAITSIPTGHAKQACGIGKNDCKIALGTYNIELPERADPSVKIPAMLYFHGAGGSGQRSMKNREMVETFLSRGYAVIAPSGLKRPGSRFGPGWSFLPQRPKQRDELAFAKAILKDASERFNLDRDLILMTGFSIGGSLTWYLACQDPQVVKAYAPVAGAFWRPHPKASDCTGPVKLLHTHGWRDTTVPLEGRPLSIAEIKQGDVFHGMLLLREINGCEGLRADQFETSGKFWKRWWTRCIPGSALQLNLHQGGHNVPKGWAENAIDWFEGLDESD